MATMDGEGEFFISIADAGALLGLNAMVAGEELQLSLGNKKLRIVLNAVAAWYNSQLVPLYGASYVQDGRWWLDVPSSLSLLQRFAGYGKEDRLRVEQSKEASSPKKNSDPPSAQTAQTEPILVAAPSAVSPIANEVEVVGVSDPVAPTASPVVTRSTLAAEPPVVVAYQSVAPETATPQTATSQTTMPQTTMPQTAVSQTAVSQIIGELRALRWSTSREKIRAVADCSDATNPEVKVVSGQVSMKFASMVDALQGIPSPYENVRVELTKGADGSATLTFFATGVRVEKLVLNDPRRIVLDFIFAVPTPIRETLVVQTPDPPIEIPAIEIPAATRPSRDVAQPSGKILVVLDPGHGGKDPGAMGNNLKEKDINLAIGLKMEKTLKAKGFDVKMTRKTDVYLKLQERTDIANKANADMFVSIHVNSLPPGKNSAGFEIYLMALPTDNDALTLAEIENREYLEDKAGSGAVSDHRTEVLLKILGDMQQNNKINESTVAAEVLFKTGNASRLPMKRVAQAPFFVLRGAMMPAVLLETGFITNTKEAKLLAHPDYQQKIADAMTDGVYNYLRQR
jgi:N-acetylmuramoyl-L-alanine amidase